MDAGIGEKVDEIQLNTEFNIKLSDKLKIDLLWSSKLVIFVRRVNKSQYWPLDAPGTHL